MRFILDLILFTCAKLQMTNNGLTLKEDFKRKKLLSLLVAICFLWGEVSLQPVEAKVWNFDCKTDPGTVQDPQPHPDYYVFVFTESKEECDDGEYFIADFGFWGLVMGGMALGLTTYMLVQHNQGTGFLPEELPAIKPTFQFNNEQMGVRYSVNW